MVPAIYTKHNCMTVGTFDNGCAVHRTRYWRVMAGRNLLLSVATGKLKYQKEKK
jgi:hypothetical protein